MAYRRRSFRKSIRRRTSGFRRRLRGQKRRHRRYNSYRIARGGIRL